MEQLSSDVFVLPGVVNIGLLVGKDGVTVIDTGIDKAIAKKILRAAKELNKPIKAIINTHGHSDHFGGNNFLVKETKAKVFAPYYEENFIRYPQLQPQCLFGGASPIKELKTKFFLAEPSPVDHVIREKILNIDGLQLEILPLSGHTQGQIGIAIKNVMFTADAYFPVETLQKHSIPFYTNWGQTLTTHELIKTLNYQKYIPSHGPILTKASIKEIIIINQNYLKKIIKDTLELLTEPKSTSEVLADLFKKYKINLIGPSQYYLWNTTLLGCLSHLKEQELVTLSVMPTNLYWKKSS